MDTKKPLADVVRPLEIEDIVGQKHLLGEGRLLRRMLDGGKVSNMIFYGPSGTGKTTLANVIAKKSGMAFHKLNATSASVADIRKVIEQSQSLMGNNGTLLYLDEIQSFNKKQQQSLLEFIETGDITLIASTTENPHFYVYNAILSRSTVFEFKLLDAEDIAQAVLRAVEVVSKDMGVKIRFDEDALMHIARVANGDVRRALNAAELAIYGTNPDKGEVVVELEAAVEASQKKALNYDRDGDNHFDVLSAFQKSIRGSDADASLHYLARLVVAGDLLSICRRILVMAAEDIGLAYPTAISITKSCVDSALQLGFPEARIPLAEAVIMLATAPKSNSAIMGIDKAIADIEHGKVGDIPPYLKDSHYSGAKALGRGREYLYPHDFDNNYVEQKYLPKELENAKYYTPQKNKFESGIKEYWEKVKNNS